MTVKLAAVTVDREDALTVGRFWSAALGRPLDPNPSSDFALVELGAKRVTDMDEWASKGPRPASCGAAARLGRRCLAALIPAALRDGCGQASALVVPGGPASTVGTYSSSCSRPSKVRLATMSRATSGYPS